MEFNVQAEIDKNPILSEVQEVLREQTLKGLNKYPNTVNVDDYTLWEWLQHAQQEMVDMLVYVTAAKQKISDRIKITPEQASAIEVYLIRFGDEDDLIDRHALSASEGGWHGQFAYLDDLSQSDLAKAVLSGYDIKKEIGESL